MREFPDPSTDHMGDSSRERTVSRWRRVEDFLETNRESLFRRISLDTKKFLRTHPVFGLRTLAAYEELTGLMPDDAFLYRTERKNLPDLKRTLTDRLRDKDERTFLEALGILADLRSVRLVKDTGKPPVARRDLTHIGNILNGFLDDASPSSDAKALRDTATLIRLGLFDDMESKTQKVILSKLETLAERTGDDALIRLDTELERIPPEDVPDPVPPQALYGLFTLADIKTIRTYAKRSDGDTTSAEHKTI